MDPANSSGKRLEYSKVLGTINPADLMTKYLTSEVITAHSGRLSADFKRGRADVAPNLNGVLAYWQMNQSEEENSEEEWLTEMQQTMNKQFHRQWRNKERRRTNLVCGLFLESKTKVTETAVAKQVVTEEHSQETSDLCVQIRTQDRGRRLRADGEGEGSRDLQIGSKRVVYPEDRQKAPHGKVCPAIGDEITADMAHVLCSTAFGIPTARFDRGGGQGPADDHDTGLSEEKAHAPCGTESGIPAAQFDRGGGQGPSLQPGCHWHLCSRVCGVKFEGLWAIPPWG